MFIPINIIDFINNSNIFNKEVFTATYKGVRLSPLEKEEIATSTFSIVL